MSGGHWYWTDRNGVKTAHSREWKMSQATALGARVLQAELFLGFVWTTGRWKGRGLKRVCCAIDSKNP